MNAVDVFGINQIGELLDRLVIAALGFDYFGMGVELDIAGTIVVVSFITKTNAEIASLGDFDAPQFDLEFENFQIGNGFTMMDRLVGNFGFG